MFKDLFGSENIEKILFFILLNDEELSLLVEEFTKKKLNKTTEKTLKNTDLGKSLNKFNTLQEMFDELNI